MSGYENGFYVGHTIFDNVTPEMSIGQQEIFGPVLCIKRVKTFEEGLELMNANPYANGSVIFTQSGYYAREFAKRTHGCMELGGGPNPSVVWDVRPEEENIQLLNTAFKHGITTFDTAEMYGSGRSETIVGKALAGIRDKCVIASKVSKENLASDDLERSLHASLKRLNTDYLDLYYIHWPNDAIPLEGTLNCMNRLKEQGVIRSIGVSNFSLKQLNEAVSLAEISAYQPEYNLLSREIEEEILPFCYENAISILGYNSLAKGLLSGAFHLYGAKLSKVDFRNEKPLFSSDAMEIQRELILLLSDIARDHNTTVSQVAIAWTLAQTGISGAIVGTQNQKHFIDNIKAVELKLSSDEIARITALSNDVTEKLKQNQ